MVVRKEGACLEFQKKIILYKHGKTRLADLYFFSSSCRSRQRKGGNGALLVARKYIQNTLGSVMSNEDNLGEDFEVSGSWSGVVSGLHHLRICRRPKLKDQ